MKCNRDDSLIFVIFYIFQFFRKWGQQWWLWRPIGVRAVMRDGRVTFLNLLSLGPPFNYTASVGRFRFNPRCLFTRRSDVGHGWKITGKISPKIHNWKINNWKISELTNRSIQMATA